MLNPEELSLVWSPFCCGGGAELESWSDVVTVVISESDIFGDERFCFGREMNECIAVADFKAF
jgi:peroxiredoxin